MPSYLFWVTITIQRIAFESQAVNLTMYETVVLDFMCFFSPRSNDSWLRPLNLLTWYECHSRLSYEFQTRAVYKLRTTKQSSLKNTVFAGLLAFEGNFGKMQSDDVSKLIFS